jgi:hypothetical protein
MPSMSLHLCMDLYARINLLSSLKCAAVCGLQTNFSPFFSTVERGGNRYMVTALTNTALITKHSTSFLELGSLPTPVGERDLGESCASVCALPLSKNDACLEKDRLRKDRSDLAWPTPITPAPESALPMSLFAALVPVMERRGRYQTRYPLKSLGLRVFALRPSIRRN